MFQLATEMEKAGLVEEVVSEGLALTDVSVRTVQWCIALTGRPSDAKQELEIKPNRVNRLVTKTYLELVYGTIFAVVKCKTNVGIRPK